MKPEKVKIFAACVPDEREIGKEYNKWMEEKGSKIEVIKRQFRVSNNAYYIALFYREK